MKRMVFCSLISAEGKKALYALGGTPEDMTGRLFIDAAKGVYEVTKSPENTKVYDAHIGAMLRRHMSEFDQGVFKERIAHQIG